MTAPAYDYMLIGHGIAGAVLGHELRRRGYRVLIYDEPRPDTASRVAAGLMNPVAGKRFALTWRASIRCPPPWPFTESWAGRWARISCRKPPILKVFGSAAEQQEMLKRAGRRPRQGFVAGIETDPIERPGLLAPHGGAWLRGGGHLRVEALLAALSRQGRAEGWLREETFSWESLVADPEAGGVAYAPGGVRAAQVVCCQGAAA